MPNGQSEQAEWQGFSWCSTLSLPLSLKGRMGSDTGLAGVHTRMLSTRRR
jgi:hypothetical protein